MKELTYPERGATPLDAESFRPHHFGGRWASAPLPFQFQIPLGGGFGPGLAIPLGGFGSPFAFTLPLGTPYPPPIVAAPVVAAPTPTARPEPKEPPLVVASGSSLYQPPADAYDDSDFGEQVIELAQTIGERGSGSTRDLLAQLYDAIYGAWDKRRGRRSESTLPAGAILRAAMRLGIAENARSRIVHDGILIVASPRERASVLAPRRGDLLVRVAPGHRWNSIGVVASDGMRANEHLASSGLRFEGYPRPDPGSYVHVIDLGPLARGRDARFARRICDNDGCVLADTMLLRFLELGSSLPKTSFDARSGAPRWQDIGAMPQNDELVRVGRVQQQLNQVHEHLLALRLPGLPCCPLAVDGRLTIQTAGALYAFQRRVFDDPAQATGTINRATGQRLQLLTGSIFNFGEQASLDAEGEPDVRWIQAALNRAINAGLTVDGVRGARTISAVKSFQQSQGLKADGIAGPRTVAALRAFSGASDTGSGARCTGVATNEGIDRFEFGKADILPSHQARIDNIAACILASRRSQTPILNITIIGHTDPVGGDDDNFNLGRKRAEAIRDGIFSAMTRFGSKQASLSVKIESRGRLEQLPGDPALSRRVEVRLPFAIPGDGPQPVPPQPAPPGLDGVLRALLTASMLLTANPSAAFARGVLPSGRQSGSGWGFSLALDNAGMLAENVTCVVLHARGHRHAMPVLEQAVWKPVELTLASGQRCSLPISTPFLVGSFTANSGKIAARVHNIWRLESEIDVGATAVFAYDITNPSMPGPVANLSTFISSRPNQTPSKIWAVVCCELVLCKPRADFEPMEVLEAARIYPLIEVLTNAETTAIQGSVTLRRPSVSAMDHNWANGGRHLVGLYTDRNTLRTIAGKTVPIPSWDELFDYFQKDAGSNAQKLTIVDPSRNAERTDGTHRRTLSRLSEKLSSTEVVKVPRQGAFDNVHVAPPMSASLSIPRIGGIPPTAVSMAPICAHDCFHMHWRWSRGFATEFTRGWGPAGPYSQAGAPMVHPNQTVSLSTIGGSPGFSYEAIAASHPANDWMVVMPHGAAYAVRLKVSPSDLLETLLRDAGIPPLVRDPIARAAAESEDTGFALFYFFAQFWPSLQSRPFLSPRNIVEADVAYLSAL